MWEGSGCFTHYHWLEVSGQDQSYQIGGWATSSNRKTNGIFTMDDIVLAGGSQPNRCSPHKIQNIYFLLELSLVSI